MSTPKNGLMRPRALGSGSKSRSFIPAKPRTQDGEPPAKKFKTIAAPRGTKLGKGYTDRARERQAQADDDDDKEEGMKRLQRLLRDGKIDQQRYESLREEIGVGGDTSNTHLVRGLDLKLLHRIRRGEDVTAEHLTEDVEQDEESELEAEPGSEVDDQFDEALVKEVERPQSTEFDDQVITEETQTPVIQTTTLSRDEILKQLKQKRMYGSSTMVTTVQDSGIDQSKFRKVEAPKPQKERFTETINGRRREVLIVTDKEGKTKRKTRWLEPEPEKVVTIKEPAPEVWGGDLPEEAIALQRAAEQREAMESSDDDIFGGVPEYNPLEGLEDDDDDDDGEDKSAQNAIAKSPPKEKTVPARGEGVRRSYFGQSVEEAAENTAKNDPTILAALKRAAQLRKQTEDSGETDDDATKSESTDRNAALLRKLQQQSRQDDVDLDMGFDGSARADEDEEGVKRQKLSVWKGIGQKNDDEDDGEAGQSKGGKRKRSGKKRKGDKNSFADVMSVIAGRRK